MVEQIGNKIDYQTKELVIDDVASTIIDNVEIQGRRARKLIREFVQEAGAHHAEAMRYARRASFAQHAESSRCLLEHGRRCVFFNTSLIRPLRRTAMLLYVSILSLHIPIFPRFTYVP